MFKILKNKTHNHNYTERNFLPITAASIYYHATFIDTVNVIEERIINHMFGFNERGTFEEMATEVFHKFYIVGKEIHSDIDKIEVCRDNIESHEVYVGDTGILIRRDIHFLLKRC